MSPYANGLTSFMYSGTIWIYRSRTWKWIYRSRTDRFPHVPPAVPGPE
jgi:hypothetical protein